MLLQLAITGLLGVLVVAWFLSPRRASKSTLPLPPGPRKLPIIGNILDLPAEEDWLTYQEWSREYKSDIIHLDVAGQSIIVLNTYECVNDLFEKRSDIYSSRPTGVMAYELIGWNYHFAFKKYGDDWRIHRKVFYQELNPSTALRYRPKQREFAHILLRNIMDDQDGWMGHIKFYSGQIILSIAYDINPESDRDIYFNLSEKALLGLNIAATPGSFLVDVMPFLKYVPAWFPGAGFQRKAKEWRQDLIDMIEIPFKVAKERIDNGTAAPSYLSYALENVEPNENAAEKVELIKHTAAAMFAAGSETTSGTLLTLILAMVWFPEVQAKAHEELDRVVGTGHLPDFGDEDSLPYCKAIIMELLRWRPVVPLSVPRAVEKEDIYRGYRIPKDSIVMPNYWAILHNPDVFPNPSVFDPERFLKDGRINPDVLDPTFIFGFGRRICPGRFMAQASLWIVVTSILATFNITKATNSDGSTIDPSGEAYGKFGRYLLPFKCKFEPRSAEMEGLVRASTGV